MQTKTLKKENLRVLIWLALASGAVPATLEPALRGLIEDPEQMAHLTTAALAIGNGVWWVWARLFGKEGNAQ